MADFRRLDRQRRAGQRAMRQSRLTAPSRSRPFERIERATKASTAGETSKFGCSHARRGDPRLQDLEPQRLVERADLDAKADAEARADTLVERFEIVRRAVGGHDHLAPGVEQGVQRMTEFGLDRLALQELGVVENEEVDRSQPLLEGDRGLGLERGDETVHESLGGQIDDRASLARGGMRDRLQEMGLAETDRRMDVKRTKGRRPAAVVVGHALRGVKGELVGPPDLEGREGQPPIEGRAGQSIAEALRAADVRRARGVRLDPARRRVGRLGRGLGGGGAFGRRILGRLDGRGTAHGR